MGGVHHGGMQSEASVMCICSAGPQQTPQRQETILSALLLSSVILENVACENRAGFPGSVHHAANVSLDRNPENLIS